MKEKPVALKKTLEKNKLYLVTIFVCFNFGRIFFYILSKRNIYSASLDYIKHVMYNKLGAQMLVVQLYNYAARFDKSKLVAQFTSLHRLQSSIVNSQRRFFESRQEE